jgi:hypothetical protein
MRVLAALLLVVVLGGFFTQSTGVTNLQQAITGLEERVTELEASVTSLRNAYLGNTIMDCVNEYYLYEYLEFPIAPTIYDCFVERDNMLEEFLRSEPAPPPVDVPKGSQS